MKTISTNIKENGVLEIYIGNRILAEVNNGSQDDEFIEEVLNGMGYIWKENGEIERRENSEK